MNRNYSNNAYNTYREVNRQLDLKNLFKSFHSKSKDIKCHIIPQAATEVTTPPPEGTRGTAVPVQGDSLENMPISPVIAKP